MIKCSIQIISWTLGENNTRLFVHKQLWGISLLICIQFLKVKSTWRRVRYNRAHLSFHKLTAQSKHLPSLLTNLHPLPQLVTSCCKFPCQTNARTSSNSTDVHIWTSVVLQIITARIHWNRKFSDRLIFTECFPDQDPKFTVKKTTHWAVEVQLLSWLPLWSTYLRRKKNNTSLSDKRDY